MTKRSNGMFLLQMTLQLLIDECIRIGVNLTLQGCLILPLKFISSIKVEDLFPDKKRVSAFQVCSVLMY